MGWWERDGGVGGRQIHIHIRINDTTYLLRRRVVPAPRRGGGGRRRRGPTRLLREGDALEGGDERGEVEALGALGGGGGQGDEGVEEGEEGAIVVVVWGGVWVF